MDFYNPDREEPDPIRLFTGAATLVMMLFWWLKGKRNG